VALQRVYVLWYEFSVCFEGCFVYVVVFCFLTIVFYLLYYFVYMFLTLACKEECENFLLVCFFWFINLMPDCTNLI